MEMTMPPFTDSRDFAHPELGREVTAIGGHYVFVKEIRLPFNSREILYLVGYAVVDSSCCGVGGCAYVFVAGFIKQWKYRKNDKDCSVSQIEPIRNHNVQKEVRNLIQNKETVFQVDFN
jgi:hypothetical protein